MSRTKAFRSCRRVSSTSAARPRWPSGSLMGAGSGGGEDYVPVDGGEAVHGDGHVIGRLRSSGYGFTVRRNLAFSYLPIDLKPGGRVEVEVFGRMVPAAVTTDAVVQREHVKG